MYDTAWNPEAIKNVGKTIRESATERGILKTAHYGVSALFGPKGDSERVMEQLRETGIEVLGKGQCLHPKVGFAFITLVQSTDNKVLSAIVGKA